MQVQQEGLSIRMTPLTSLTPPVSAASRGPARRGDSGALPSLCHCHDPGRPSARWLDLTARSTGGPSTEASRPAGPRLPLRRGFLSMRWHAVLLFTLKTTKGGRLWRFKR